MFNAIKHDETSEHADKGMLTGRFRTSSFCESGGCVAVAAKDTDKIVVKSTITGQEVNFSYAEWRAFTQGVKANEFELT